MGRETGAADRRARRGPDASGGLWLTVAAALATLVTGCASTRTGVYHRVRPGENLYRIGKAYGVPFERLGHVNGVRDPARIRAGALLFVPEATRPLPVHVITPQRAQEDRPAARDLPTGGRPFVWPVATGVLTSRFGPRGETFHDGIDISAPAGTPVHAARTGEVLYSDKLSGYGNVIIVGHGDGYVTVYAHNSGHLVRTGERVRQGQMIARVGQTGRASGPNLHFEVRKDNVARNPLYYLPPVQMAAGLATRQ